MKKVKVRPTTLNDHKDILLEALSDYKHWFMGNDPNTDDALKLKEISEATEFLLRIRQ